MSKAQEKALARWTRLNSFDDQHRQLENLSRLVIGVDEVGRGSLVGPVVSAAVCFMQPLTPDEYPWVLGLDDSKSAQFNHEKRLHLAKAIQANAAWGLGQADLEEIETLNILHASLLASKRAVEDLCHNFPQINAGSLLVLMDGNKPITGLTLPQQTVIKGDSQSAVIAAASIVAKAYRDDMLIQWAQDYPYYHWDRNAGYPTPEHKAAIAAHGVTALHRKTYKTVAEATQQLLMKV